MDKKNLNHQEQRQLVSDQSEAEGSLKPVDKGVTRHVVPTRFGDRVEYRNQNGKLHRLDGPAVEWNDGDVEYWFEGRRHRLNGPAIECADGTRLFFVEGKLHRLDGPAIEYADGTVEFWVEGKEVSKTNPRLNLQ